MAGMFVRPSEICKGDRIATVFRERHDGEISIVKSHEVKKVEFCKSKPEMIHIDSDCYDNRFSTLVKVV